MLASSKYRTVGLVSFLILLIAFVQPAHFAEENEKEVSGNQLDDDKNHNNTSDSTVTTEDSSEIMDSTEKHEHVRKPNKNERQCEKSEICTSTGRCPEPGKYPSFGGCRPLTL